MFQESCGQNEFTNNGMYVSTEEHINTECEFTSNGMMYISRGRTHQHKCEFTNIGIYVSTEEHINTKYDYNIRQRIYFFSKKRINQTQDMR